MKRVFWNVFAALCAGACLRLFFVLKFPANSGDTVLYEQMATNWLKHGVYAMEVNGTIQPVDLRMPGYPAYLALVYWLTGKTAEAAHFWVMLGQVIADLVGCVLVVWLAGLLLVLGDKHARQQPVWIGAIWLAALSPFTANYTAVPLTETFAVTLTALALIFLVGLCSRAEDLLHPSKRERSEPENDFRRWTVPLGLILGIGTLFRPETPLLLVAAWAGTAFQLLPRRKVRAWIRIVLLSGLACVIPLLPWAARNFVTLHEVQFLAPKNSNLPGELVPSGFMAWEKTWMFRMKDCYVAAWKLNGDVINVEDLPQRAFDSNDEKQRVAMILERYNEDLTLTKEEDAAFGQLASERTARYPWRTYVRLPLLRVVTFWFTPRIELLPVAGHAFPLAQMWEDDKVDQSVTIGFFFLNILYVGLGIWGAVKLWSWSAASRAAVLTIGLFILLRTAFLTTLETPEPRYELECFPALFALGAIAIAGRKYSTDEARPA
jgi:hypothetical protein